MMIQEADGPGGRMIEHDSAVSEGQYATEETHSIRDKQGRPYDLHLLENHMTWILKVYDGATRVSQVNCLIQGQDLFVADLHVFEAATHPLGRLDRMRSCLWFGWTQLEGSKENYQRRGLGNALLDFIERRAVERGFVRITGKLFPRDLERDPTLPNWYQRRGFRVVMNANRTAGEIELVLHQDPKG